MTTPLALGVLALLLARPVPDALSRFRQLEHAPRAAVVLWQALALAAVLAMLGAGLSAAAWLVLEDGRPHPGPSGVRVALHVVFLVLTAVVAARLGWSTLAVGHELRSARRRHRMLLDLVGRPSRPRDRVRVLETDAPAAYCVPGTNPRVVISRGTLSVLRALEIDAVLAHESAHLRARHDLVLEGFSVLHRAFPRLLRSGVAAHEVRVLVEMLADDAACRRQRDPRPLARALVSLRGARTPAGALGATGALARRLDHLAERPWRRTIAAGCYAAAAVVIVGPTAGLAGPWLYATWTALA